MSNDKILQRLHTVEKETSDELQEAMKKGVRNISDYFSSPHVTHGEQIRPDLKFAKDLLNTFAKMRQRENETIKTLVDLYEKKAGAVGLQGLVESNLQELPEATGNVNEALPDEKKPALSPGILNETSLIPVYNQALKLPDDNYLITCDYHSPYHSIEWHNRSLAVAKRMGIRKIVIIGDLLDFGFASFFYSDNKPDLALEKEENARLIQSLLDSFDEIYLLKGNHEDRLGRKTDGMLQAQILLELWTKDAWQGKFKYSPYSHLSIGDKWVVIHPKSYSQISGQVAKKLAARLRKNVINAHGHFLSYGYEPSGINLAIDMGGMFDTKKIEYKSMRITTHPEWNNGFGVLRNGFFTLFDQQTDWDTYWLD